ncbi:hypothetical protein DB30_07350 [Enhygromyxa salina]|uniref:Uncharacterized protein n=1 Tax=Enhygromyxa salina TaxID=215803 RepID=A0A0C1ZSG3_9BACT|nr:hypothetical protein [Enhygromyxa salina]KIG14013.1 hypothetical protein DB30_07350 [Enhygromyxa salina]
MDTVDDSRLGALLAIALGPLREAGLIDEAQRANLVTHAKGFPPASRHKLFFEFELVDGALELAGYGHGFRPQALAQLLADGSSFATSKLGRDVLATLCTDPFDPTGQRSRRSQDGEIEWFEYDVDGATIAERPGLFFALPPHLRRLYNSGQLRELLDELAARVPSLHNRGELDDPRSFEGFLDQLGAREFAVDNPLRTYRIGLSENRAPGWLRLVIGGLRVESLDELAARALEGPYLGEVPRRTAALFTGDERSKLSGSVDVVHGRLRAIDLEGPYLFHIRDTARRIELGRRFCARLRDDGVLAPDIAEVISELLVREIPVGRTAGDAPRDPARLLLNHFKFGVAGRHRGRVKLYFELLV